MAIFLLLLLLLHFSHLMVGEVLLTKLRPRWCHRHHQQLRVPMLAPLSGPGSSAVPLAALAPGHPPTGRAAPAAAPRCSWPSSSTSIASTSTASPPPGPPSPTARRACADRAPLVSEQARPYALLPTLHGPIGWALATLVAPRPGERVLDPMCGRGGGRDCDCNCDGY